jgi:very-short-patch-repair endonuclease
MRQDAVATARARQLRGEATAAENCLWQCLRGSRLGGLKVRRKVPLGPFVADFYLPSARLVIDLGDDDPARHAWLRAHGFAVLRLPAAHVAADLRGTLARIARAAR